MSNTFNKYLFLLILLLKGWSTSYADQKTFDTTTSVATFKSVNVKEEPQFITQHISNYVFSEQHQDSERESYFEISEIEDKTQDENEVDESLSKFGSYLSAILHAQFFECQFCVVKEKAQRFKEYIYSAILKLHVKFQVFII
ncbi:hypothetical protein [Tenacibaculum singaporense]|uniref:hypothetical protein n=1 Tax=Tenacibaculum singaporense TaxID=2358479 RepID=UPI003517DF05